MRYLSLLFLFALFAPFSALAHEKQIFEINGTHYQFTVGSLNEPVVIDDRTGVDLRVSKLAEHDHKDGMEMMDMDHSGKDVIPSTPVTGLEKTLRVEIEADGAKKGMDLATVWGTEGAYKATFYPTKVAVYSYRIFGILDGASFDVTFTCDPKGHAMTSAPDKTPVDLGGGVVRHERSGTFGCPSPKEAFEFPAQPASLAALSIEIDQSRMIGWIALALAAAGIAALLFRSK
jgi:hypothetical protein